MVGLVTRFLVVLGKRDGKFDRPTDLGANGPIAVGGFNRDGKPDVVAGTWGTPRFVTTCAYGINLEVYIEIVNFACQRAMAALAIELTLWEFALTITKPLRS